jgi:glycine/D-amino acid oxidase-like deaminating enzyme
LKGLVKEYKKYYMSTNRLFHDNLYQFDQAQPSFWEATAGPELPYWPALSGDQHNEVAVIGGGYTGMSTALHLARDHGRDVRVLEAGHIGWGASGRNSGFCSVGSAKMSIKRQLRNYGKDQTHRYFETQSNAVALCRDLIDSENMDFKPQGEGEWVVAESHAHFKRLRIEAEEWSAYTPIKTNMVSQQEFANIGYDAPHQHGAMLINSPHVYVYYRLLPDNRLMIGGRGDNIGHPDGAHKTVAGIHAKFAQLWPEWSHVEFEYSWRGLICFNQNFTPAVSQLSGDDSVFLGYGYHGNGVATATWSGKTLANWIATEKLPDSNALPAIYHGRSPRFFIPKLRKVYGRIGLEYYLTLDKLFK